MVPNAFCNQYVRKLDENLSHRTDSEVQEGRHLRQTVRLDLARRGIRARQPSADEVIRGALIVRLQGETKDAVLPDPAGNSVKEILVRIR